MCPVCTVAVGAGVGISRWLGIDDTVTGVWIGGLLVSATLWTDAWLASKRVPLKGQAVLIGVAYLILTVLSLWMAGIMGHPFNRLWGIDKLLVGMAVGGLAFLATERAYAWIKRRNNDGPWFPFQKVAMPLLALIVASGILYLLTK